MKTLNLDGILDLSDESLKTMGTTMEQLLTEVNKDTLELFQTVKDENIDDWLYVDYDWIVCEVFTRLNPTVQFLDEEVLNSQEFKDVELDVYFLCKYDMYEDVGLL